MRDLNVWKLIRYNVHLVITVAPILTSARFDYTGRNIDDYTSDILFYN